MDEYTWDANYDELKAQFYPNNRFPMEPEDGWDIRVGEKVEVQR